MERDNFISSIILSLVGLFVVKKIYRKGREKGYSDCLEGVDCDEPGIIRKTLTKIIEKK